jgi:hypothetical protein
VKRWNSHRCTIGGPGGCRDWPVRVFTVAFADGRRVVFARCGVHFRSDAELDHAARLAAEWTAR